MSIFFWQNILDKPEKKSTDGAKSTNNTRNQTNKEKPRYRTQNQNGKKKELKHNRCHNAYHLIKQYSQKSAT